MFVSLKKSEGPSKLLLILSIQAGGPSEFQAWRRYARQQQKQSSFLSEYSMKLESLETFHRGKAF